MGDDEGGECVCVVENEVRGVVGGKVEVFKGGW